MALASPAAQLAIGELCRFGWLYARCIIIIWAYNEVVSKIPSKLRYMPIVFASGDLFATPDVIAYAHGVNCAGAMGAGIAVEFKKRYPKMYKQYKALCKNGGLQPGDVFAWQGKGVTVFNLATQKHWNVNATLEAVESSVSKMLTLASQMGIEEIVLPRIGAGLGGLDWIDVASLLIELVDENPLTLLVAEEFVAGQSLRSSW